MILTKNLGIKLCKKKGKDILKDDWIYSSDLNETTKYFNKLLPENSVILIGLNNDAKLKVINSKNKNEKKYLNIEYDKIFNNLSDEFISKRFIFSFHNFSLSEQNFDNSICVNITKNNYISSYTKLIETDKEDLDINPKDIKILFKTNVREFKYLKDTSFRLPKVKIILDIYHPFFRPGNTSTGYNKHCIFFEFILYLTYIQRQVKIKLADAIRAGNKINIGYTQNNIYVNVFAFSDVAQQIMLQIKEIMENGEFQQIQKDERFELYMQSALEDNLNSQKTDMIKKAKYLFYESLNKNMYRHFEFPQELNNTKIFNEKCNSTSNFTIFSQVITEYIINCFIFGYYNKTQANEIVNIFNKSHNNNFDNALVYAGLTDKNLKEDNFTKWITQQDLSFINNKEIKNDIIISKDSQFERLRFIFLYWSKYSNENRINIILFN